MEVRIAVQCTCLEHGITQELGYIENGVYVETYDFKIFKAMMAKLPPVELIHDDDDEWDRLTFSVRLVDNEGAIVDRFHPEYYCLKATCDDRPVSEPYRYSLSKKKNKHYLSALVDK